MRDAMVSCVLASVLRALEDQLSQNHCYTYSFWSHFMRQNLYIINNVSFKFHASINLQGTNTCAFWCLKRWEKLLLLPIQPDQIRTLKLTHSTSIYLLSASSAPGYGDTEVDKSLQSPCSHGVYTLSSVTTLTFNQSTNVGVQFCGIKK